MTPEQAALIWDTLRTVGVGGILAGIVFVFYKGWVITASEADRRVAATESQVTLLKEQLEKREALYQSSQAEQRTTIKEGNEARDRLQASLDKNVESMYRFVDVLGDLRDSIRAMRGGP